MDKEADVLHQVSQWESTVLNLYLQAVTSSGHVSSLRMDFKFTKTYNVGPFWSDGLGENSTNFIEVKQFDQLNGNTAWQYFEINAP